MMMVVTRSNRERTARRLINAIGKVYWNRSEMVPVRVRGVSSDVGGFSDQSFLVARAPRCNMYFL